MSENKNKNFRSENNVEESFNLEWNRKRGLELLGDKLYREPFISGLQETIKNSIEENAKVIELTISDDKTIIIEKGGKGIPSAMFKKTIGTIFTESKDKKHFGIGRLGILLTHAYTDYYSNQNGIVSGWRIMSDGKVDKFVPVAATEKDDFSIKIIGYDKIKNGYTISSLCEQLKRIFGLPMFKGDISLIFNGKRLKSPLSGNVKIEKREFEIRNTLNQVDVYWQKHPNERGFSVTCENGIGVRIGTVRDVIVYFDQDGYLPTTMNREDFQRGYVYNKFMDIEREVLRKIIPRKSVSDEALKELASFLFKITGRDLYKNITSKKKMKRGPIKNKDTGKSHTARHEIVDYGEEYPFIWFDKETQYIQFNRTHPLLVLVVEKWNQRRGRLDNLILPMTRCQEILKLAFSEQLNWNVLTDEFTKADARAGKQLTKVMHRKQHTTIEEEFN